MPRPRAFQGTSPSTGGARGTEKRATGGVGPRPRADRGAVRTRQAQRGREGHLSLRAGDAQTLQGQGSFVGRDRDRREREASLRVPRLPGDLVAGAQGAPARVSVPVEAEAGGGHIEAPPDSRARRSTSVRAMRAWSSERRSSEGPSAAGGELSGMFHSPRASRTRSMDTPWAASSRRDEPSAQGGGSEPHGGARRAQEGWVTRASELQAVNAGVEAQRLHLEAVQACLEPATPQPGQDEIPQEVSSGRGVEDTTTSAARMAIPRAARPAQRASLRIKESV